jgi:hypothetical protein
MTFCLGVIAVRLVTEEVIRISRLVGSCVSVFQLHVNAYVEKFCTTTGYLALVRFRMTYEVDGELDAKNFGSDGVKLVLKVCVPITEGFQVKEEVKLGDVPEVVAG